MCIHSHSTCNWAAFSQRKSKWSVSIKAFSSYFNILSKSVILADNDAVLCGITLKISWQLSGKSQMLLNNDMSQKHVYTYTCVCTCIYIRVHVVPHWQKTVRCGMCFFWRFYKIGRFWLLEMMFLFSAGVF